MDETSGGGRRERTIKVDDTPVRVYATRLTDRLRADSSILFSDLVKKDAPRQEKIGWFLALLLLLKNETAGCAQEGSFGEIRIFFRGEAVAAAATTRPTTSNRSVPRAASLQRVFQRGVARVRRGEIGRRSIAPCHSVMKPPWCVAAHSKALHWSREAVPRSPAPREGPRRPQERPDRRRDSQRLRVADAVRSRGRLSRPSRPRSST